MTVGTRDPERMNRRLCDAARQGDTAQVEVLIAEGADPDGYWDPVEARRRHEIMREQLLAEADRQLVESLRAVVPDEVRDALDVTEAPPTAPYASLIPLFCAVQSGSMDCVRALLDAGADVSKHDDLSRTAMWYVTSADVARHLAGHGLSTEDRDCFGWTPLDAAAEDTDALSRVEALLAAGADVHATHDRGFTVFMSAASASERDPRLLERLVAAGADPHAVTELGYNAFHAAIDVNGEANAEPSVRGILASLQRLGVDIEHRTTLGYTPLARAIEEGTGTEARVLCELGADPNATGPRHVSSDDECSLASAPLIFAAIASAVDGDEKLAALLDAGAVLDVVDESGLTPIEHARQRLEELEDAAPSAFTAAWLLEARRCVELLDRAAAR